jgi:hypothetical protein
MIVLGLLMILVAVGAAVFVVIAPLAISKMTDLTAVGVTVSASPLAMFVAGAVSLALLGLGYALVSRGTRRRASSRKELRELRKGQAATDAQAPAEAGQHSSRRDRPHADSDTSTVTGTSTGTEPDSSG